MLQIIKQAELLYFQFFFSLYSESQTFWSWTWKCRRISISLGSTASIWCISQYSYKWSLTASIHPSILFFIMSPLRQIYYCLSADPRAVQIHPDICNYIVSCPRGVCSAGHKGCAECPLHISCDIPAWRGVTCSQPNDKFIIIERKCSAKYKPILAWGSLCVWPPDVLKL